MEFDSPDVEKDFPGLYASESGVSRGKKDESDFSDADHDKVAKKGLLIGRPKDKKDKKDRGYAALQGDSSPEEETETKSPSKSLKKVKAFKFPTKSKEKREKSRDKEKLELSVKEKEPKELGVEPDKKKKDKDKKEKEKKEKTKDKDKEKKDKKLKQSGSLASEEILDLGDAQPIFGVSLGLSVERSRCHDSVNLPLVVRDCIDYLQAHGLTNETIYKADANKLRLISLKKLYNNRESSGTGEFDVPTACGLLKMFLNELPEPILTTDLLPRFEEAAALPEVTEQQEELSSLVQQLPSYNRILISWLILHFDEVTLNEKSNKINAQNLAMLLSPSLQMSHRLLVALLCHCSNLFSDTKLFKYIPPITASSPNLPETSDEISKELCKQESLLNQIHSEMNAGFVSKKREEQLWEVQRIITQLKRKFRSFEKKQDSTQKSVDDTVDGDLDLTIQNKIKKLSCSDDESSLKTATILSADSTTSNTDTKNTPQHEISLDEQGLVIGVGQGVGQTTKTTISDTQNDLINNEKITLSETGILLLPENHPDYLTLIRLQLENLELIQWKTNLQSRINYERSEMVRMKNLLPSNDPNKNYVNLNNGEISSSIIGANESGTADDEITNTEDLEKVIADYIKENNILEQKRNLLARDVFNETAELVQLQVELNLQKYKTA